MSASEKEQLFYVGWVDRRTDPWPGHEHLQPKAAAQELGGKPVEFLPADHPDWPGLPCVRGIDPPTLSDGRMGRYTWPGIPIGDHTRVYAGPTISALLHPRSAARLPVLTRAYLLYQPEIPGNAHDRLSEALFTAAKSRRIKSPHDRLEIRPVSGISDPTDFNQIIAAVKEWLRTRDPFGLTDPEKKGKPIPARRVLVNLSPGTTAMAASWLILFWSGALGGTRVSVEFVQGDGGLDGLDTPDNPTHQPLREVPVDVLAMVKTAASESASVGAAVPRPAPVRIPAEVARVVPEAKNLTVDAEALTGRPYDKVRERLERAALIGEPVVIEGERGTGKTFLAEFYHRRRQEYRWGKPGSPPPSPGLPLKLATGKGERPNPGPPWKGGTRRLVKVTLSEFATLDELKSSLFGWKRKSFTGAGDEDNDGLLGESHEGTLFLDEIHHLPKTIQRLLLGPLNRNPGKPRSYTPMNADYTVQSEFDLICASNDPQWREKLMPDLHDRIALVVVRVPPLRVYQKDAGEVLWRCWEATLRSLCDAKGFADPADDPARTTCAKVIEEFLLKDPLPGNWRDLQTLAAYVLYEMIDARSGRALPSLVWSEEQTRSAIRNTLENRRSEKLGGKP